MIFTIEFKAESKEEVEFLDSAMARMAISERINLEMSDELKKSFFSQKIITSITKARIDVVGMAGLMPTESQISYEKFKTEHEEIKLRNEVFDLSQKKKEEEEKADSSKEEKIESSEEEKEIQPIKPELSDLTDEEKKDLADKALEDLKSPNIPF